MNLSTRDADTTKTTWILITTAKLATTAAQHHGVVDVETAAIQ